MILAISDASQITQWQPLNLNPIQQFFLINRFFLLLIKTQQLVAIVVVLFFTHAKLCCKLCCKLSKFIQNPNDFRLDGKGFFRIARAGDGDE